MPDLDANWPYGSQDAIGQAAEFLVWASLIAQSGGSLHVFLPMLDRGIDALVHRQQDGAYLALQVKGVTALHGVEAPIAVFEDHLFTPDQVVIGVHVDSARLGPFVLVADAATFKRKAGRIEDRGRVRLVADMPMHPIPGHKWSEDLVPLDQLSERLAPGWQAPAALPPVAVSDDDRVTGFWGEQEVCRRLAMLEDCGLFRPSTTLLVALAWVVPEHRFHETCLVIPTDVLPSVADIEGPYYQLHFRPAGSRRSSRLDSYRVPLESLTETLAHRLY